MKMRNVGWCARRLILSQLSADSSLCRRSQARGRVCGGDQSAEPVWRLCNRPLKTFARSPLQLMAAQRWQVAAALSAAVTTTNHQETAPNLQAEPSQKKRPTPNATRSSGERVWGRGASLREAASPPASPSPQKLGGVETQRMRALVLLGFSSQCSVLGWRQKLPPVLTRVLRSPRQRLMLPEST